eukprot:8565461-Pyramimonas_sp.AAC.1
MVATAGVRSKFYAKCTPGPVWGQSFEGGDPYLQRVEQVQGGCCVDVSAFGWQFVGLQDHRETNWGQGQSAFSYSKCFSCAPTQHVAAFAEA